MEFLILFLFYLVFILLCVVVICICFNTHSWKVLILGGAQICACLVPGRLQRAVQGVYNYLLHTRNRIFVVLHLILQVLVYAEYSWEIFGYCYDQGFTVCSLVMPYLLLTVNLGFFFLTCMEDPGTITKANESVLLQAYEFDEVMFWRNAKCPTCDLRKPARSKHCRVCDRCVHRFDHHCIWVNNCIGAWNARYFLIYLSTLTASAATMAIVCAAFLAHLVVVLDLYQETYIDDSGHVQAFDTVFLIQYLFLSFPRIVFLLGFVVVLSFLLAGYLCFMLYLVATNQTTNEWCRGDWACSQHCPLVTRLPPAEAQVYQNIHSHGLWSNLREVFLPVLPCSEKKTQ
uniref:palmitoyltransferase ZDHHC4 isoform X2 n=1 Tax=Jaculus jaculus TaxID=51337 RepID=UPI001E1B50E7|nr:palmitoyltransferase ZDHHC4 isoform X2 [Jaculus jaculus]XP_045000060.1 palmitoyltransferase ZDHHC4 isoform X2 [Jaculus jaculus]XP_045000061.1 palmitoyltransferase ZDHHC4 isoform X2 [Jaculus jaculus]XP_045000062.1 palmitoyltransferase ZDHHC4 isoform X2 [Jaculus jaculus]